MTEGRVPTSMVVLFFSECVNILVGSGEKRQDPEVHFDELIAEGNQQRFCRVCVFEMLI